MTARHHGFAVETGAVAVADDMTGPTRGHREHQGRDQQDDAGRRGKGKGSPAAWGRKFSDRCRFGGPRSARWCNSPASEPGSWGDPEIAASSQPGEGPQTLKYPGRRGGFEMLTHHLVVLGASSHGV